MAKDKPKKLEFQKKKVLSLVDQKQLQPPNTNDILDKYINHKITNTETASIIGVFIGSFFRLAREHKK